MSTTKTESVPVESLKRGDRFLDDNGNPVRVAGLAAVENGLVTVFWRCKGHAGEAQEAGELDLPRGEMVGRVIPEAKTAQ